MLIKNVVYALECPNSGKVVYVGKSVNGLQRPYSHKHSHNIELRQWVSSLDTEPVVKILERECDDLDARERYWINEMKRRNEPILNRMIPTERQLRYANFKIGEFVRMKRKEVKLTQKEFANKAGVGLRFIRELESGKETCRLDKMLQVLYMFGASLVPIVKDPYQ